MNRLKELRKEKGLTQQDLASEIGTTKLTVSNWENEKHVIKSDKAQQLADYFNVPVGYLLGYESTVIDILELATQVTTKKITLEDIADSDIRDAVWNYLKTHQTSTQNYPFPSGIDFQKAKKELKRSTEAIDGKRYFITRTSQKQAELFEEKIREGINKENIAMKSGLILSDEIAEHKISRFYEALNSLDYKNSELVAKFMLLSESEKDSVILLVDSLSKNTLTES